MAGTVRLFVCGMALLTVACSPARPARHAAPGVAISAPPTSGAAATVPAPRSQPLPASNPSLAQGRQLYTEFGCNACHDVPDHMAPPLRHVRGSKMELADGRHITVDDDFVRGAVIDPQSHLVAGYAPTMPTYRAMLAGKKLDALVAYVMSR